MVLLNETKNLIKDSKNVILNKIAMHLHDTYGQALANIYASLQMGVATLILLLEDLEDALMLKELQEM